MKSKSRRLLSTLLALALAFGLLAITPLTASADGSLAVTLNPVGATYILGATAVPLKAEFTQPAGAGNIYDSIPITVQWFWTLDPLVVNEMNGAGATPVDWSNPLVINTEHTPDTSTVGVKYYYAVVTYAEDGYNNNDGLPTQLRARTNPARVEVTDGRQNISVLKTDDKGNPLAGATIRAAAMGGTDVFEVITGNDGRAIFYLPPGSYIISESKAPQGYNASDRTYIVYFWPDGRVEVEDPSDDEKNPVLFVNTPIDGTSVTVLKTDDEGKPLPGATIRVGGINDGGTPRVYDVVTDSEGKAVFILEHGEYDITERAAPAGYNATDAKFKIRVTANGVFLVDPVTNNTTPYTPVTFINKPIPDLERDDHFAFARGYPEGDFRPERDMTRAEAVVMFHNLLIKGLQMAGPQDASVYPDLKPTDWYYNYIGFMHGKGVLVDYTRDGKFRGDEPVTRAEFATLAAHFENLILTDTNIFSDVPNTHWAVKYINSSVERGWIQGYPDGTFRPDEFMTRAEIMVLVGTILDRKADSAFLVANASTIPVDFPDISGHWAYLAIREATIAHDYERVGGVEVWTAFRS